MGKHLDSAQVAVFRHGHVELEGPVSWAEGTRLLVMPADPPFARTGKPKGFVIIAGFGLPGRCVADYLDQCEIDSVIVENNRTTVEIQTNLGRKVVLGDITDERVMLDAGITHAAALALTIPDEEAVLKATESARRLHPGIYIIARTNYASSGMQASRLGADDVVKAEQAVAFQFYEKIRQHLSAR